MTYKEASGPDHCDKRMNRLEMRSVGDKNILIKAKKL